MGQGDGVNHVKVVTAWHLSLPPHCLCTFLWIYNYFKTKRWKIPHSHCWLLHHLLHHWHLMTKCYTYHYLYIYFLHTHYCCLRTGHHNFFPKLLSYLSNALGFHSDSFQSNPHSRKMNFKNMYILLAWFLINCFRFFIVYRINCQFLSMAFKVSHSFSLASLPIPLHQGSFVNYQMRLIVLFIIITYTFAQAAAAATAKSLQSCPTLCDPIDGSPSGSPVPGILQARTLEWVAISFSNAGKWKNKVK